MCCNQARRAHSEADSLENIDIAQGGELEDSLKVVYKYCFAKALFDAAAREDPVRGSTPVIEQKDGDDDLSVAHVHRFFLKKSFNCDFKMTEDEANQHPLECDGCEKFKEKPTKSWYEVAAMLPADEKAVLEGALFKVYAAGTRSKSSNYVFSWIIAGDCGVEHCKDMISGASGKIEFTAKQQSSKGGFVHIANDGAADLSAAEIKLGFVTPCKATLEAVHPKYAGISSELCASKTFVKNGDAISNVAWTGGGNFEWQ